MGAVPPVRVQTRCRERQKNVQEMDNREPQMVVRQTEVEGCAAVLVIIEHPGATWYITHAKTGWDGARADADNREKRLSEA